jgi:hypothetical protein
MTEEHHMNDVREAKIADLVEAMERSEAEITAGTTVPSALIHSDLCDALDRIEARLKGRRRPEKG